MTQVPKSALPFHQIILLDNSGKLKYSCETLTSVKSYRERTILQNSPFLESIFPELLNRKHNAAPLRYSKLENPYPGLLGTYDFSFQWVDIHDGRYILLNIYDLSDLYKTIKKAQQRRNEKAITIERLNNIPKKEFQDWGNSL